MRKINTQTIKSAVKSAFLEIGVRMNGDVLAKLKEIQKGVEDLPAFAMNILCENAKIASETNCPLCQDTGMAVVFLEVGQEVFLEGEHLADAINAGVREAYAEGYFRKSVLDPVTRRNTGDNTPAIIHTEIVAGDRVKIGVMCKGFGSENMTKLFMLTPAEGVVGIKKSIVDAVLSAGSNPCPPCIVGVGIGGTAEKALLMSKKALFRSLKSHNKDPKLAEIEADTLAEINEKGVGVAGLGSGPTALAVFADSFPTHLAGLPVAITIQCNAVRHKEVII